MRRFLEINKFLALIGLCTALSIPARGQGIPATANLTAQDSGPCTTANACLTLNIPAGSSSAVIQLSGTWSATVQFEASTTPGGNFTSIQGYPVASSTPVTSSTSPGAWRFNVSSVNLIRARVSTYVSGTVVAAITASQAWSQISPGINGGNAGGGSITPNNCTSGEFANGISNTPSSGTLACGTPPSGPPAIFSVLNYGAKCDNSTDDTAAIQSAITAAEAVGAGGGYGGTVVFPNAFCKISDAASNPDGTTYSLIVTQPGIAFSGPSTSYYGGPVLQYSGNGTAIQVGTPKEAVPTSIARSSNVVTANFATMSPQFIVRDGNTAVVSGVTGGTTSFNGTFTLTGETATTATWAQSGANESGTVSSSSLIKSSYDNNEYDGVASHTLFDNINITCTSATTTALLNGMGNYATGAIGIADWRSGWLQRTNSRIQNCAYGFYGVQSQIDSWFNVADSFNHLATYLGPRSDNFKNYSADYFISNDQALWVNGARDYKSFGSQYQGCSTTTPVISASSQWRIPSTGGTFESTWFETSASPFSGTCPSFVALGVGDPSVNTQEYDFDGVFFVNNLSAPNVASFIEVDQADHVHIKNMKNFPSTLSSIFVTPSTTCALTDATIQGNSDANFTPISNSCAGTAPVVQIFYAKNNAFQAWNGQDNPFTFTFQAGKTSDQTTTLKWRNHSGASVWDVAMSSSDNWFVQDDANILVREQFTQGGASELNSFGASSPVNFNLRANSGTGGIAVGSGGATPVTLFEVSPNGAGVPFSLMQSSADIGTNAILNSGVTAGQAECNQYQDRGTAEWQLCKNADNSFQIYDAVDAIAFIRFTQGISGGMTFNGPSGSSTPYSFSPNANDPTGGVQFYSGGTTSTLASWVKNDGTVRFGYSGGNYFSFGGAIPTSTWQLTPPQASGTISIGQASTCGITTSCTPSVVISPKYVFGSAALTSGTPSSVTITGLPFTSSTSYVCTATDATSVSAVKVAIASGGQMTITGPNTVTDSVNWFCAGS